MSAAGTGDPAYFYIQPFDKVRCQEFESEAEKSRCGTMKSHLEGRFYNVKCQETSETTLPCEIRCVSRERAGVRIFSSLHLRHSNLTARRGSYVCLFLTSTCLQLKNTKTVLSTLVPREVGRMVRIWYLTANTKHLTPHRYPKSASSSFAVLGDPCTEKK